MQRIQTFRAHALGYQLACLLFLGLAGCKCPFGNPVTVARFDPSSPAVVVDFYLPTGQIVSITPSSPYPSEVDVPVAISGKVKIVARGTGAGGIQDIQLTASQTIYTYADGSGTLGPGPGSVSASNPDNAKPGQTACTERVASADVIVSKMTKPGKVVYTSYEVLASAVNFSYHRTSTPPVLLTIKYQRNPG